MQFYENSAKTSTNALEEFLSMTKEVMKKIL